MHLVHSFPIRALSVRAADRMFPVPEKASLDITRLIALNGTPMPLCHCEIRKVKSGNIADNIHPAGTDTKPPA